MNSNFIFYNILNSKFIDAGRKSRTVLESASVGLNKLKNINIITSLLFIIFFLFLA